MSHSDDVFVARPIPIAALGGDAVMQYIHNWYPRFISRYFSTYAFNYVVIAVHNPWDITVHDYGPTDYHWSSRVVDR